MVYNFYYENEHDKAKDSYGELSECVTMAFVDIGYIGLYLAILERHRMQEPNRRALLRYYEYE